MVVQHNLRAMNSNRMLGLTASTQSKSAEKLSSGYKINRAADDAAGLSISEKMRKQIRGLSQASLNAADGISAVQTAEGALNEVQDMLQRMNELAVKASNGTMSEDDRNYIQDEIDQLKTEVDRVAETTKFNETYLLKGDGDVEGETNFSYKEEDVLKEDLFYIDGGKVQTVKKGEYASALDANVKYFDSTAKVRLVGEQCTTTTSALTSTKAIDVSNYYTKNAKGEYELVAKGSKATTSTTYYTVSWGADGKVSTATTVTAVSSATYYEVNADNTVYFEDGKALAKGDLIAAGSVGNHYVNVSDLKYKDGDAVDTTKYTEKAKSQFTDKDGNEIAENGLYRYLDSNGKLTGELFFKNGNKVGQEDIDKHVKSDDKFERGSLSLKLHVGADATDNNQIQVDIQAMDAGRLGISDVNVSGKTDEGALNAIETIKEAIQMISTQRSALGAVQNRLEHTINNLDNVVENTTAAESQIRDTDMATEMVKYSNNNILAQAGQAMLAQANQANQGVLSILG